MNIKLFLCSLAALMVFHFSAPAEEVYLQVFVDPPGDGTVWLKPKAGRFQLAKIPEGMHLSKGDIVLAQLRVWETGRQEIPNMVLDKRTGKVLADGSSQIAISEAGCILIQKKCALEMNISPRLPTVVYQLDPPTPPSSR